MLIAICQFAITDDPVENAKTITTFAEEAASEGAKVLVTPETSLVRLPGKGNSLLGHAEPLDGPFIEQLKKASRDNGIAIISGTYTPGDANRVVNTLAVVVDGELVTHYDKIHLYDAFTAKESDTVKPGPVEAVTVDIEGIRFGLTICYDLRFPEIFRALADKGAQAFIVPAAWAKGTSKEEHWFTLLRARAIENTSYVLASGDTGETCIGRSAVFDPMGLQLADLGDRPGYQVVEIRPDRLDAVREVVPTLLHRRFEVSAVS